MNEKLKVPFFKWHDADISTPLCAACRDRLCEVVYRLESGRPMYAYLCRPCREEWLGKEIDVELKPLERKRVASRLENYSYVPKQRRDFDTFSYAVGLRLERNKKPRPVGSLAPYVYHAMSVSERAVAQERGAVGVDQLRAILADDEVRPITSHYGRQPDSQKRRRAPARRVDDELERKQQP